MMKEEFITILLGASPFLELRGAIPTALFIFQFTPLEAYFLSVLGNLIPIIPLLFFYNRLANFLMMRFYFLNRLFTWLFSFTRNQHDHHFKYYCEGKSHTTRDFWLSFALFIFVALPIPGTGAWAGTLAAFVFGIPFWRAVFAISLGVAAAGLIALAASLGIFKLIF